jgi:hypothetical protein
MRTELVLSEEKASGFRTEPAGNSVKRITDIGLDPWLVRNIAGVVQLKRADAAKLRVSALDPNGYPVRAAGNATEIKLDPHTVYYLIRP